MSAKTAERNASQQHTRRPASSLAPFIGFNSFKAPGRALRQPRVLAAHRVSGSYYYLHYVSALRALVPLA